MGSIVHFGLLRMNEYMYAACCLWTCKRVKCTLLASAVTCKSCRRMKAYKSFADLQRNVRNREKN